MSTGEFWFFERHRPHAGLMLKVTRHLESRQSKYQRIDIFDTVEYGRVMTIDNLVMLTERDEFAYHEMLAHVPMLTHPDPRRVLVIGGGDGGILRELVKHETVEKAVQVEIDSEVIDLCKRHFPWAEETYSHPKVELVIENALEYIKQVENSFDVIIVDSTDPVGPAVELFEPPFYRHIHRALTSDGIMSAQLDAPFYNIKRIGKVFKILRGIFSDVGMYLAFIPGYPSGVWGLGLAQKSRKIHMEPDEVRYNTIRDGLKYYNLEVHRGSFMLPEYMRREINKTE